jgi:hypothetical protein
MQMILWIAATVVGVAGILIVVWAWITNSSNTYGIALLGLMTVLLLITWSGKSGRDKGDAA